MLVCQYTQILGLDLQPPAKLGAMGHTYNPNSGECKQEGGNSRLSLYSASQIHLAAMDSQQLQMEAKGTRLPVSTATQKQHK